MVMLPLACFLSPCWLRCCADRLEYQLMMKASHVALYLHQRQVEWGWQDVTQVSSSVQCASLHLSACSQHKVPNFVYSHLGPESHVC